MEIPLERCLWPTTLPVAPLTLISWMINTSTMFRQHMQNASKSRMRRKNNMLSVYGRSWTRSSRNSGLIPSLDVRFALIYPCRWLITSCTFSCCRDCRGCDDRRFTGPERVFQRYVQFVQRRLPRMTSYSAMKSVCETYGALFILDEVRSHFQTFIRA